MVNTANTAQGASSQEGDVHANFSRMVDSSTKADEALIDMYKKGSKHKTFFQSYDERMCRLNEPIQAWVMLKMSEIFYQAEMHQINTPQSSYYQNNQAQMHQINTPQPSYYQNNGQGASQSYHYNYQSDNSSSQWQ